MSENKIFDDANVVKEPNGEVLSVCFTKGMPPENGTPVLCLLDDGSLVAGEMALVEKISSTGLKRVLRSWFDLDQKPTLREVPEGQIMGYTSAASRWPARTVNQFIQTA